MRFDTAFIFSESSGGNAETQVSVFLTLDEKRGTLMLFHAGMVEW